MERLRLGPRTYHAFSAMARVLTLDPYRQQQQAMVDDEIRLADTSRLVPGLSETDLIQQLVSLARSRRQWQRARLSNSGQVLQFLQHDGYVETARAFAEELESEKDALRLDPQEPVRGISIRDDEDAHNRQRIRRAVLEGDIDHAMKYTEAYYPTVLRDNEQVYFRLRCRKFIEMIRKEAELNMLLEERRNRGRVDDDDNGDEDMLEVGAATTINNNNNNTNNNSHHNGGDDDNDMDMPMTESEDNPDTPAGLSKLSQEALAYGMELRAEFKSDPRRETARQLDEIFSLIAYPNPLKVKEVAHLLDGTGRVAVAEELNSAILCESLFSFFSVSVLASDALSAPQPQPLSATPCPGDLPSLVQWVVPMVVRLVCSTPFLCPRLAWWVGMVWRLAGLLRPPHPTRPILSTHSCEMVVW
jgi:hypothetical protein